MFSVNNAKIRCILWKKRINFTIVVMIVDLKKFMKDQLLKKNIIRKKLKNYAQDSQYLIYDHSLPRTNQKQCPNVKL